MESEKLKQIEEIYHLALEFLPTERTAFLKDSCGADDVLAAEVQSLLEFDKISENFLVALPEPMMAEMYNEEFARPSLINTKFGHYKIIGLLGKGGMGEVYLAEDTKLDRKVALKILPPGFAADEMRMTRFVREAKSASALNHPNIITIYEIGELESLQFIATEFINGKTLNEYGRDNRLNINSVLEIAVQIASALDEAHSAGIIHRDIKPDNVMIRTNGLVKILDFGIAKPARGENAESDIENESDQVPQISPKNPRFTRLGTVIGTADYMSPEQSGGKAVDARTDIFSFGVVLFEMLTGHLPSERETAGDTTLVLRNEMKVPDAQILSEVTVIINKCLKANRDERYQTIRNVLAALEGVRTKLTSGETGKRLIYTTDETHPHRQTGKIYSSYEVIRSKSSLFKWLIAVLTVCLLTVTIYLGTHVFTSDKRISSVAVMPFTIDSDRKDAEYLSDGITELLISRLSNIPDLSIKARNTVFTYKRNGKLPSQIGLELKVDAVLFGTIIQRGDQIRLKLELVETEDQNVLWGKNYEVPMSDLVSIQRRIAGEVSEKLQMTTDEDRERVEKVYTTDPEAHQLYLKGRFHWNKRDIRDFELATEYFRQAVERDPNYTLAYTGLADTYALMPLYGNFRPREYMPQAKQAALKALELDENLAQAHASLGRVLNSFDYDWAGAELEFTRSIELNPNYATVHQWYAEFLAFRGRTDEALLEISKALDLDPLSLTINRMRGNILSFAGRQDEAFAQLTKTAELYPENALVRYNLGDVFAAKGMFAKAVDQYLIAFDLEGQSAEEINKFKTAFETRGWTGFWREHLNRQLKLQRKVAENEKNSYFKNESLAYAYAASQDKEKTLEYLNKAFDERDPQLITIKNSKVYDFLANDVRFKELLKKIGLPE